MAEITFDKFWGWLSPTSLYAQPWQCAYLEGVEATQNISRVKNSSTWSKKMLTDGNQMWVHFTATWSLTSREWYAWEGGQIYTDTSDDNIPEKQLTNTKEIKDYATILWGIFLIQPWSWYTVEVSRMDEENASLWGTWDFNEALWISDNDTLDWDRDNTNIVSFWESTLVVAKGSKIYYLWVVADWAQVGWYNLSELSVVDIWREVIGISTTTDFIKFYTKDGRILMYNKAYTLVSETYTGELFHQSATINNRDYIVWEDGFYYVEWNTLVDILKDGDKWLYNIQNNRKIFSWRSSIYLYVDINNDTKLLRVWTDNAGFPQAMTVLPMMDDNWSTVSAVYWVGGRFNISAWLNVATVWQGVYDLNWSTSLNEWIIITEKFNDWNSVETKEIVEIIISGKFSNSSTVETIINDDETSTPVILDNGWDKNIVVRTSDLNAIFLDLAIKVVLKGSDQLYWIKLKYNDEKK